MAYNATCVADDTETLPHADPPRPEEDDALMKSLVRTSLAWRLPSDDVLRRAARGIRSFMQRCDELLGDACFVNESVGDPLKTLRTSGLLAAVKKYPDEKDVEARLRYARFNHCLAEEELEYILPRMLCTVRRGEMPLLDDCSEIRQSPLHGVGIFATKTIPAGTLIFQEPPLIIVNVPRTGSTVVATLIEPIYKALSPEQKQTYARLYVGPALGPKVRFMENVFAYNARQITSAGLMGVGEFTGRLNHSCCPNAHLGHDCGKLGLRALRDIPAGEEITINYVYMLHSRRHRRAELSARYGFNCTCARCNVSTSAGRESQFRSEFLHEALLETQSKCTSLKPDKSGALSCLPKDLDFLNKILEHYELEDVIDDSRFVYMQVYIQRLLENGHHNRARFVAWKMYHLRKKAFGLLSEDSMRFISQIYVMFRCGSKDDFGIPSACACIDHKYEKRNDVTPRELLSRMTDDKLPLPELRNKDFKTMTTLVTETICLMKQDPSKPDGTYTLEAECEVDFMAKRPRWERKGLPEVRPSVPDFIKGWFPDDF